MRHRISFPVALLALAACAAALCAACGDDAAAPPAKAAVLSPTQAVVPKAGQAAAPAAGGYDECREAEACERKCASDCASERRDRTAFYASKKAKIASSPFEVQVERVFFQGACGSGDVPEKRKATSGLRAMVEGTITYKGDDLIYSAELEGSAYFRFGDSEYSEVAAANRSSYGGYYGYYGRPRETSRILRAVHGSDPWRQGQTRAFHWESSPFSEAFCEASPREAAAYVELLTYGTRGGRAESPVALVPLRHEEILGMALRQQVKIRKPTKEGFDDETADAQYSKLDRMLVTRLTGTTEWVKRASIVQSGMFDKGPAAAFPVEGSSAAWSVAVGSVSETREFGGYAPKGEDQFLAVLDVKITNRSGEAASLKGLSPRLEVEPGKWQKPVEKALGQLDFAYEVPMGGSTSGKLVFPRQRFQRPFRLEAKTPDGTTLYLDVLSYDFGPPAGR